MSPEDFDKLVNRMVQEETKVSKTKGKEYTQGGDDRLKNFKDTAKDLGLDPLNVCFIYMKKHIDSITSYIKHGRKIFSDETIESRIKDIRVYCCLLRALVEEAIDVETIRVDGEE